MNTDELNRLTTETGNSNAIDIGFLKVELKVDCDGNSSEVLRKTKEVLVRVIDCELSLDDPIEDWKEVLPAWFVNSCAPELSSDKIDQILAKVDGFEVLSKLWTVGGFLYWFRPEERSWFWWGAVVKNQNAFIIELIVEGFPFAWGALDFLLHTSGAAHISEQ